MSREVKRRIEKLEAKARRRFSAQSRPEAAVTFEALLRRIDIKALRSMDKGAAVTFEIDDPSDDLVDQLNRIMRADSTVNVGVWL